MPQDLRPIISYCDERLDITNIEDYEKAFNGLQFENNGKIHKIASAVDASLESIKKAAQSGVDLLLTHHGLFWGNHVPVTNATYEKYKLLIQHDIALYSCHLPLDAHPEIGNNAIIAKHLNLQNIFSAFEFHHVNIGIVGKNSNERNQFRKFLGNIFPRVTSMEFGPQNTKTIGICSGGSGDVIAMARALNVDTMIIGECNQYHYNIAREEALNVYVCGHYATETFGVTALGSEVAQKFALPFEFLHSECPL